MSESGDEPKGPPFSRRDLGKIAVGGVATTYAGAIAYPVVRYLATPPGINEGTEVNEVTLDPPDKYEKGSGVLFRFGKKPALLLRRPDGEFVALIATCQHLGCTVQYQSAQDRIFCACHGGVYDPGSGKNVSGPPPRPLERLTVDASGEKVIVRRA
jgi:cytochrome b6-f complex iron-sulfur subunit